RQRDEREEKQSFFHESEARNSRTASPTPTMTRMIATMRLALCSGWAAGAGGGALVATDGSAGAGRAGVLAGRLAVVSTAGGAGWGTGAGFSTAAGGSTTGRRRDAAFPAAGTAARLCF